MRLTLYTDYSLRVLIHLGVHGESLASVAQISKAYGISRHHVVKVVHRLGVLGYVETVRGRSGGLRLARPPAKILLGEIVRRTEKMNLVECFDREQDTCPLTPSCTLKHVLSEAADAFLAVLDRYTLGDLLKNPKRLQQLLSIGEPAPRGR